MMYECVVGGSTQTVPIDRIYHIIETAAYTHHHTTDHMMCHSIYQAVAVH